MNKSDLRVGDRLKFVRPICYALTRKGAVQQPLSICKSKSILQGRLLHPSDVIFKVVKITPGSYVLRAEGALSKRIPELVMKWCHQLDWAHTSLKEVPESPISRLAQLGIQYSDLKAEIVKTVTLMSVK